MNQVILQPMKLSYDVEEEIKTLRTSLQFFRDDKRVILFTSCIPGEGKSVTSYSLASSLTGIGKKVLLIDADLRKGKSVVKIKAGKAGKGLSHYLSGQAPLTDVITTTDIPNFHMIFSGPVPPDATELLSGQFFANMIEIARRNYDYIIIDTSPLGLVVDASIIAEHCDGSILMIESGNIKYRFAQEVKKKLENSGCSIMGVVLNKVDWKKSGKYYGKYYRKYYGNYYGSPYGGAEK